MTNYFDNQNLLETVWKWKKHLIIISCLAILFSAVFSSSIFIKPKYKSTARIYPSFNIYTFSSESESEQLLEFINSQDIKFRVINAFNLSEVYHINKKDPLYQTYILTEFNDNVRFKKTEYETIEISVLDTDPKRACAMCDSIVSFLDDKIRSVHGIKYKEMVDITSRDLKRLDHQIDSIRGKMDILRKDYKILDYESQSKEVTRGMVKIITEQKQHTSAGKEIQEWMKNLSEKGGEYEILAEMQRSCLSERDSIKKVYDQSFSNYNRKINYGQRIQSPVPADKKSYPVRWLIILISTFASLFLAMLVILVLENRRNV
jgi:capsular polysaccharide biosynthesis protein